MTGIDFLQMINDIDDDLLEDAAEAQKKHIPSWTKWAAIAASFFILFGLGFMVSRITPSTEEHANEVVTIYLNGKSYDAFSRDDYLYYGLLVENEAAPYISGIENPEARTVIQAPSISKEDLGSKMGVVEIIAGGKKIKCNVYHYIAYADSDNICILELAKDEYKLFISKE